MKTEKDLMEDTQLVEMTTNFPNIQAQAVELIVDRPEAQVMATELRSTLKKWLKLIDEKRFALTRPLDTIKSAIVKKADSMKAPLERLDEKLDRGLIDYHDECEKQRIAAEAQRAREEADKQAALDKLNKEADKAETFAETVVAEEKIEETKKQTLTPDVAVAKTVRGHGGVGTTSFRTIQQHEITDADLVPRELCVPSDTLIREAYTRRGVKAIAGVRIFKKTITSQRR